MPSAASAATTQLSAARGKIFTGMYRKRNLIGSGALILLAAQVIREIRAFRSARKQRLTGQEALLADLPRMSRTLHRVREKKEFLKNFGVLLKILIPRWTSTETAFLLSILTASVARAWFDIWVAKNNAKVVRAIVTRNWDTFLRKAVDEIAMHMFPIAITSSLLKYLVKRLALRFRKTITAYYRELYLSDLVFYRAAANVDSEEGLQDMEQQLTTEMDKFATQTASIFANICQPIFDILFLSRQLKRGLGVGGPVQMILYFVVVGAAMKRASPMFSRYAAKEQRLEDNFRFAHARLVAHAEDVAYYAAGSREKGVVEDAFNEIERHQLDILQKQSVVGMLDSILVKYMATSLGYYLVSRPVFGGPFGPSANHVMPAHLRTMDDILEHYTKNAKFLYNMSLSVGKVYAASRDISRLKSLTNKLLRLRNVLMCVREGSVCGYQPVKGSATLRPGMGTVVQSEFIGFKNVPVVSPIGKVLCRDLNFEVRPGHNLIISGPRDTGKSSIIRILADLWPVYGGVVHRPSRRDMFIIGNRPYFTLGTLRDQIIYPDTASDMFARGVTDDDLDNLLSDAQLSYLTRQDEGWNSIADYEDTLGSEAKQRLAICRLFYHRPRFAVLDECTNCMSLQEEEYMLQRCKDLGITLITVSNRQSTLKYHDSLLQFDYKGEYTLSKINPDGSTQGTKSGLSWSQIPDRPERIQNDVGVAMKRVRSHSCLPDMNMIKEERRILITRLKEIDGLMNDIEQGFDL